MTGRTLLVGPFTGQLLDAAAARVTSGVTVVTPNLQAGLSLTRGLAARVPLLTLTQAARTALRAAGWRLLRPGERDRRLAAVLDVTPLEWLDGVQQRASTGSVLLGLIGELQRAHLNPADVQMVASSARERDVARVYAAYHAGCQRDRVYDAAGSEHWAARLDVVAPCPVILTGFFYLDAAQLAFAVRLCAPGSVATLPAGPGAPLRTTETAQALHAQGWAPEPLEAVPATIGDRATAGFHTGTVVAGLAMGEAADVDAEVRHALRVVRDWLREGVPPEQIAVIVRSERVYLETLADVGAAYRVPLLSGLQRPLADTAVGRVVAAWLRAHAGGWRYEDTRDLLTDPLLGLDWALERAHALRASRPAGLTVWSDDVAWLALPEEVTRAQARRTLERLFGEGAVHARCRQEPDLNRAVATLRAWLRRGRGEPALPRERALAEIAAVLRSATQPALNARSGVRVLNPLGALGRTFRRVLLLGVSDGVFPARRSDHPVIDAATRQAWARAGVHLPDVTSLASVEEALFLGCVATAREALVVTRPRRNLAGTRLAPSPFWSRLEGDTALPERPPATALEREVGRAAEGRPGRRAACGAAREEERQGRILTPHSGQIGPVDVTARVWTLPELQTASLCRMRWFVEHTLGVPDPERVRTDLARAALDAAATSADAASRLRAAAAAIDERAGYHRQTAGWWPGPLWAVTRAELLAATERALQHRDWPAEPAVRGTHARSATVMAGRHALTVRFRVDRLDGDGSGTRVTLYRGATGAAEEEAPLTADHQLALTLDAVGAASGRYVSVHNGEVSGTLLSVARPAADSPLVTARAVLAGVMEHLTAGDVRPRPAHARVCGACPARGVCRAGVAA